MLKSSPQMEAIPNDFRLPPNRSEGVGSSLRAEHLYYVPQSAIYSGTPNTSRTTGNHIVVVVVVAEVAVVVLVVVVVVVSSSK